MAEVGGITINLVVKQDRTSIQAEHIEQITIQPQAEQPEDDAEDINGQEDEDNPQPNETAPTEQSNGGVNSHMDGTDASGHSPQDKVVPEQEPVETVKPAAPETEQLASTETEGQQDIKQADSDSYADNYIAEERADQLMKDSKFTEAINLLAPLPHTQRQQMYLMECYSQLGKMREVLECLENMKVLFTRPSRFQAVEIFNLGLISFKNSLRLKSMALFACAAKRYLHQPNIDAERLRGIAACSTECKKVVKALVKGSVRKQNLARDVGTEIMKGFVDDIKSVPHGNTDTLARCLNNAGYCYSKMGEFQKGIECYDQGIDTMKLEKDHFKYSAYGKLLHNKGYATFCLGNNFNAVELYKESHKAKCRAEDWPDATAKKKSIEDTQNCFHLVQSKIKK